MDLTGGYWLSMEGKNTSESSMTRARLIFLVALATTTLTACETIKGVGRDITRAADAVDRAI